MAKKVKNETVSEVVNESVNEHIEKIVETVETEEKETPAPTPVIEEKTVETEEKETPSPVETEEVDKRIREIFELENYFNYLSCGRLVSSKKLTTEELKDFYKEWVAMGHLVTPEHYELSNLLKNKLNS